MPPPEARAAPQAAKRRKIIGAPPSPGAGVVAARTPYATPQECCSALLVDSQSQSQSTGQNPRRRLQRLKRRDAGAGAGAGVRVGASGLEVSKRERKGRMKRFASTEAELSCESGEEVSEDEASGAEDWDELDHNDSFLNDGSDLGSPWSAPRDSEASLGESQEDGGPMPHFVVHQKLIERDGLQDDAGLRRAFGSRMASRMRFTASVLRYANEGGDAQLVEDVCNRSPSCSLLGAGSPTPATPSGATPSGATPSGAAQRAMSAPSPEIVDTPSSPDLGDLLSQAPSGHGSAGQDPSDHASQRPNFDIGIDMSSSDESDGPDGQ